MMTRSAINVTSHVLLIVILGLLHHAICWQDGFLAASLWLLAFCTVWYVVLTAAICNDTCVAVIEFWGSTSVPLKYGVISICSLSLFVFWCTPLLSFIISRIVVDLLVSMIPTSPAVDDAARGQSTVETDGASRAVTSSDTSKQEGHMSTSPLRRQPRSSTRSHITAGGGLSTITGSLTRRFAPESHWHDALTPTNSTSRGSSLFSPSNASAASNSVHASTSTPLARSTQRGGSNSHSQSAVFSSNAAVSQALSGAHNASISVQETLYDSDPEEFGHPGPGPVQAEPVSVAKNSSGAASGGVSVEQSMSSYEQVASDLNSTGRKRKGAFATGEEPGSKVSGFCLKWLCKTSNFSSYLTVILFCFCFCMVL